MPTPSSPAEAPSAIKPTRNAPTCSPDPSHPANGETEVRLSASLPSMLADQYGLPLSTASATARDAYLEGCAAKLTMYPGAIAAFDRAIEAEPTFALPHAARAHALLERGDA